MIEKQKIEKILEILDREHYRNNELAYEYLEKGNMSEHLIHAAESVAFGRIKMLVEDICK